MAKVTRVEIQCDMCNRTDAQRWAVETPDGQRSRVDLCGKHGEALRRAFTAGRNTHGHPGPVGVHSLKAGGAP